MKCDIVELRAERAEKNGQLIVFFIKIKQKKHKPDRKLGILELLPCPYYVKTSSRKFPKKLLKLYLIASKTYNLFKLLEKYIFWTNYCWAKAYAAPPPPPTFNIGGGAGPPVPTPM